MKDRIRCFFLTPVEKSNVVLRRFRSSDTDKCSSRYGYCTASIVIEVINLGSNYFKSVTDEMKSDSRWPTKCEHCGYVFKPEDSWQWGERQLYERSDTKDVIELHEAPPGAMWNAEWMNGTHRIKKRPDGLILCLKTPGGDWIIDGGSSNGDGWERTGAPPDITANPSIICGSYHGWLRNGWLEEC